MSWTDDEDEHYSYIDFSVYESLRDHYPFPPLLPNLQELSCYDSIVDFLDLFLGPSVRCLNIGVDEDIPADIFPTIEKYGQSLRELRLLDPIDLDDEDVVEAASQALCSLNNLATLKWNGPIPEDSLVHLAKLHSLTSFTYAPSDLSYKDLLVDSQHSFPSLHKLVLLAPTHQLERATYFLGAIRPRLLVQLEITPEDQGPTAGRFDSDVFSELLCTISGFRTLTALEITLKPSPTAAPMPSPLLTLNHLLRLHVRGVSFALVAADIETMSKAWPRIQELRLSSPFDESSSLSMSDLLPFAARCPNLAYLTLSIGHSPSTVIDGSTPRNPHPSLKFLHIGTVSDDISEHAEKCAVFLAEAFPNVTFLGSFLDSESSRMATVEGINHFLTTRRLRQ